MKFRKGVRWRMLSKSGRKRSECAASGGDHLQRGEAFGVISGRRGARPVPIFRSAGVVLLGDGGEGVLEAVGVGHGSPRDGRGGRRGHIDEAFRCVPAPGRGGRGSRVHRRVRPPPRFRSGRRRASSAHRRTSPRGAAAAGRPQPRGASSVDPRVRCVANRKTSLSGSCLLQ